eukprot:7267990-Prymnesium_polylepis.1
MAAREFSLSGSRTSGSNARLSSNGGGVPTEPGSGICRKVSAKDESSFESRSLPSPIATSEGTAALPCAAVTTADRSRTKSAYPLGPAGGWVPLDGCPSVATARSIAYSLGLAATGGGRASSKTRKPVARPAVRLVDPSSLSLRIARKSDALPSAVHAVHSCTIRASDA